MAESSSTVVGVDACPVGWLATILEGGDVRMKSYREFEALSESHSASDRILVDIPIGFPEGERRTCDEVAKDLLGSRGLSVFYPPCRSAAECTEYREASDEHENEVGHGLSTQAHNIRQKILEVTDAVAGRYDGQVREGHPELCFAALNGQPIAYSKSSARGRGLRMELLSDELDDAEALYREARNEYLLKEVRRDDILDSMVLAVAAQKGNLTTVPANPSPDEPRIYYPGFEVPVLEGE